MRRAAIAMALVVAGPLGLVGLGCTGKFFVPPGAGGGAGAAGDSGGASGPRAFFEQKVAPMLLASCASCHMGTEAAPPPPKGPPFLGATLGAFYGSLKSNPRLMGNPTTALLLTKGLHEGPAWTPAQADTVHQWLVMEDGVGGNGGSGGSGSGGAGSGGSGGSGSGGSDGGAGGAGGSGTPDACGQLLSCCDLLPLDQQADCQFQVQRLSPDQCQPVLDALQQQGYCL
ncbi:MAG TPA: hypothetical protein VKN99_11575 [Polyangia bacterium]|nr:hypothetical protein [Polyangia bacterium]